MNPAIDFSLNTDFHAHIIPGVDDGSTGMEESLKLIRIAYDAGIRTIYATPHYRRHEDNHSAAVGFDLLLSGFSRACPDIAGEMRLLPGHELVYHGSLIERLRNGEAFTMGGSDVVLIEFNPGTGYRTMYQQLRELLNAGYIPMLAHMERYDALRDTGCIEELRRAGCLMQMNYQSLSGDGVTGRKKLFGGLLSPEVLRCRKLVRSGLIDCFGTDMHRLDFRPPCVADEIAWIAENVPVIR